MPTVSTEQHYPGPGERDCRDCGWFEGLTSPTSDIAFCGCPKGRPVKAQASHGCVDWVRRVERTKRHQVQRQEPGDPRPEPLPNWSSSP